MISKKIAAWIIIFTALVFALAVTRAFGEPGHHQNSLGVVIDDLNPYVYLVGLPIQGSVFECDKNVICTNAIIRPYGTDLMHTESVTFCGNESGTIINGNQVFVYRRVATRFYDGIACHDLEKVLLLSDQQQEPGQ